MRCRRLNLQVCAHAATAATVATAATDSHSRLLTEPDSNRGPSSGAGTATFERDVGSFTTIRVGWPEGIDDAERNGVAGENEITVFTQVGGWDPDPRLAFQEDWSASLTGTYGLQFHAPSAGFQALALAIAMANDVGGSPPTAYGFGACAPCGRYYDPGCVAHGHSEV